MTNPENVNPPEVRDLFEQTKLKLDELFEDDLEARRLIWNLYDEVGLSPKLLIG